MGIKERAQKVATLLAQRGTATNAIKGILANAYAESSITTTSIEPMDPSGAQGIGLLQWSWGYNQDNLWSHLSESDADFQAQVNWIFDYDGQWGRSQTYGNPPYDWHTFLAGANGASAQELAIAFDKWWERPYAYVDRWALYGDEIESWNLDYHGSPAADQASGTGQDIKEKPCKLNDPTNKNVANNPDNTQGELALSPFKYNWHISQDAFNLEGSPSMWDHTGGGAWDCWGPGVGDQSPIYAPFGGTIVFPFGFTSGNGTLLISNKQITTGTGDVGYGFFYSQHGFSVPVSNGQVLNQGDIMGFQGGQPAAYVTGIHTHIMCGLISQPDANLIKKYTEIDSAYGDFALRGDLPGKIGEFTPNSNYSTKEAAEAAGIWTPDQFFSWTANDLATLTIDAGNNVTKDMFAMNGTSSAGNGKDNPQNEGQENKTDNDSNCVDTKTPIYQQGHYDNLLNLQILMYQRSYNYQQQGSFPSH